MMGLTVTAGCSQLPGGSGSDSALRGEQIEQVSKTFTLQRGKFEPFKLSFDRRAVLLFSVVADEKIDIITFERPQFQTYKETSATEVPYIDELSEQNTRATALGSDVTKGNPVIVVDNTTWAAAQPVEEVEVEIDLEAFLRT